jgi:hypothetical protein
MGWADDRGGGFQFAAATCGDLNEPNHQHDIFFEFLNTHLLRLPVCVSRKSLRAALFGFVERKPAPLRRIAS